MKIHGVMGPIWVVGKKGGFYYCVMRKKPPQLCSWKHNTFIKACAQQKQRCFRSLHLIVVFVNLTNWFSWGFSECYFLLWVEEFAWIRLKQGTFQLDLQFYMNFFVRTQGRQLLILCTYPWRESPQCLKIDQESLISKMRSNIEECSENWPRRKSHKNSALQLEFLSDFFG